MARIEIMEEIALKDICSKKAERNKNKAKT